MVNFFVVRHGFSLSNKDGTFTGQLDVALSSEGKEQAKLVSDYILQNIKVDVIFSSDLSRAVDTVKKVSEVLSVPIFTDKRFRECYCGEWEGKTADEIKKLYPKDYALWQTDIKTARCTGGETMLEVEERAIKAMLEIARKYDGKNVIIATHGGVIKMLQRAWEDIPYDELGKMPWATNASITAVSFDDGKFKVHYVGFDEYLGKLKTEMPKGI